MPQDHLQDLLDDPDRDFFTGAAPVVSYDPNGDDPEFLGRIKERAAKRTRLIRRGIDHGHFALLDHSTDRGVPLEGDEILRRWRSARPVVLPNLLSEAPAQASTGCALFERLKDGTELRPWINDSELPAGISPANWDAPIDDADRDLQKITFDDPTSEEGQAWLKLAKLSNHPDDDSLRLRIGFGRERSDDASPLIERQRLISRLGRALLPGMEQLCVDESLTTLLSDLLRGPPILSQPLIYWNRPEGGALFHHDAFGEDSPSGQRGVLYVQFSGETLWLALSINDLATRVREITEAITLGELAPLREHLYPDDGLQPLLPILASDDLLREELGMPGCGRFASLVNYGPSFSAWLADSGHACVLGPGDAILLPNHGAHHTCMHSVFCVSDHTTYALSLAIRLDTVADTGSR